MKTGDEDADMAEGEKWPFPIRLLDALKPESWGNMEPTADGLIHYKDVGPATINSKLADIDGEVTGLHSYAKTTLKILQMGLVNHPSSGGMTGTMTDLALHYTTATLGGGALADHPLYQPGAGKAYQVFGVYVGMVDLVAAGLIYTLDFHDEDGNVIFRTNHEMKESGHFIPLYNLEATDDKDLECSIFGGAGVEVVDFLTLAGKL